MTKFDIENHIRETYWYLRMITKQLWKRAKIHDNTMLKNPELDLFLDGKEKQAWKAHYKKNTEHPEFHEEGIDGMDLLDLIEFVADLCAECDYLHDHDIHKLLREKRVEYKIKPQLFRILENTATNQLELFRKIRNSKSKDYDRDEFGLGD